MIRLLLIFSLLASVAQAEYYTIDKTTDPYKKYSEAIVEQRTNISPECASLSDIAAKAICSARPPIGFAPKAEQLVNLEPNFKNQDKGDRKEYYIGAEQLAREGAVGTAAASESLMLTGIELGMVKGVDPSLDAAREMIVEASQRYDRQSNSFLEAARLNLGGNRLVSERAEKFENLPSPSKAAPGNANDIVGSAINRKPPEDEELKELKDQAAREMEKLRQGPSLKDRLTEAYGGDEEKAAEALTKAKEIADEKIAEAFGGKAPPLPETVDDPSDSKNVFVPNSISDALVPIPGSLSPTTIANARGKDVFNGGPSSYSTYGRKDGGVGEKVWGVTDNGNGSYAASLSGNGIRPNTGGPRTALNSVTISPEFWAGLGVRAQKSRNIFDIAHSKYRSKSKQGRARGEFVLN